MCCASPEAEDIKTVTDVQRVPLGGFHRFIQLDEAVTRKICKQQNAPGDSALFVSQIIRFVCVQSNDKPVSVARLVETLWVFQNLACAFFLFVNLTTHFRSQNPDS